ncbi:MAG TPA: hypothetical protein VG944_03745, partial [Fimbriimonas sp.]|nr:hypothetical protein [Fimbriimonas sp.]
TTDQNTWTWETSFDTFAGVTKSKAATSFITVNYGTGTPSEAAGWVQYANVTKKYGYKYWEVGNECYGGWETDTHARANDPTIYAQQFKLYYNAMKAKDPTIKVGAVANPGEDSFATYTDHPATNPRTGLQHNGWTPVMLATLKGEGVTPDFIIYHNYPQAGNESDFGLLQSTSGWATDIGSLRQMLTDYLGADTAAKVQIDCTENNSDATSPGKQMCSLVNGLYLADSFGSMLQTECQSMMWWDLLNGQDTGGNNASWLYGWRQYGDYGVVDADFNPYPVFYVHKLLSVFATSGDSVLPVTTDYGLLTAYAVARQSGTLQLLVVNKNPTATLSAQISLSGYIPQPDAKTYSYGIPQDNAAQTGAGSPDVASGGISNAGPTTVLSFPPYSATVIVFKKQSYFFPG